MRKMRKMSFLTNVFYEINGSFLMELCQKRSNISIFKKISNAMRL